MDNSEIIVIDSERLKNSEGLLRHTTAFFKDIESQQNNMTFNDDEESFLEK